MRILVLGSNAVNKGAEAMLYTVLAELGDRIPGASFCIGDWRARQWHPEGLVALGMPYAPVEPQGRITTFANLALRMARAPEGPTYWLRRRDRLAYAEALANAVDGAVDVSGFLFSDQRGTAGDPLLPVVDTFARRGKPFVFLPQAWGPFEDPRVHALAKRAISSATLTFARDDISRDYIRQLDADGLVEQASDIAFLFRASPDGRQLVARLGLDPGRPIVAIAPNMRVYERTGGEGSDNLYGQALTQIGRSFLDQSVQILLVPHEILPASETRHDDRYLCQLIADTLGAEDVGAVTEDCSAADLKAMIGVCELMIGSRFHALIAALSSGVPSVAVGWAHKYPELLAEFGLETYVLDHSNLTPDDLQRLVTEAWQDRSALRSRLLEALPHVKARSAQAFDATRDALCSA
ncbi:MAG: polysaccharide pyruvyl transferase family protein [Bacteroidota bacterium]